MENGPTGENREKNPAPERRLFGNASKKNKGSNQRKGLIPQDDRSPVNAAKGRMPGDPVCRRKSDNRRAKKLNEDDGVSLPHNSTERGRDKKQNRPEKEQGRRVERDQHRGVLHGYSRGFLLTPRESYRCGPATEYPRRTSICFWFGGLCDLGKRRPLSNAPSDIPGRP